MADVRHFVVIGLGSFGRALARKLCENGCRVTGLDAEKESVEGLKDVLYEAIIGDATDRDTLNYLPIADADAVFISLGEDITLSMLATLHVKEMHAKQVVVKGVTEDHGKILERLGVDRVVFPESEIAVRLADRMTWPNVLDFLPIGNEYRILEIASPESFAGKTLIDLDVRRRYNVWIVGVKDVLSGQLVMFPGGEYKLGVDQVLVVIGKETDLNKLRDVT